MRRFRVHMNTLEQLAIFLPLLWLTAFSMGDVAAAVPGTLWPVGRILYAAAYYKDPSKRLLGFTISMTANVILLIECVVGICASL